MLLDEATIDLIIDKASSDTKALVDFLEPKGGTILLNPGLPWLCESLSTNIDEGIARESVTEREAFYNTEASTSKSNYLLGRLSKSLLTFSSISILVAATLCFVVSKSVPHEYSHGRRLSLSRFLRRPGSPSELGRVSSYRPQNCR